MILWRDGDDEAWSDDHWRPHGTQSTVTPEVGALIGFQHAVWRVVEFGELPLEKWTDAERERATKVGADALAIKIRAYHVPHRIVLRPAHVVTDDPRVRDHDQHYRVGGGWDWHVYPDEHYAVCGKCAEPLPCREKTAERVGERAMRRMARYEAAGVCPGCLEFVSSRQKSLTFRDNLEVPAGPPLTFHLRGRCWSAAADYEKRWVAADPERRRPTLSCPGRVTNHNDGTYDCTELGHCPGPRATHSAYTVCRCPDCHARGTAFGCRPSATARLNGTEEVPDA